MTSNMGPARSTSPRPAMLVGCQPGQGHGEVQNLLQRSTSAERSLWEQPVNNNVVRSWMIVMVANFRRYGMPNRQVLQSVVKRICPYPSIHECVSIYLSTKRGMRYLVFV